MNAGEWSKFYSNDEFLSTIAGTDYYETKNTWSDERSEIKGKNKLDHRRCRRK
jgi:hypothetical protein